MLQMAYTQRIRGIFFYVFLGIITLVICENIAKADDVPVFFLKIAKVPTLPRIGRSNKFDFFYEKHIPRIGRDTEQDEQETLSSYTDLTKRRIDYPSKEENLSLENFPLAIEGPKALWRTLAGYSRDRTDDIDNEIWQRNKRTETESITMQEK